MGGEQAERRGKEILAAVKRGLEMPDRDLPRIERPARRAYDPAFEARLERLKAARNRLAGRLDLPAGGAVSERNPGGDRTGEPG